MLYYFNNEFYFLFNFFLTYFSSKLLFLLLFNTNINDIINFFRNIIIIYTSLDILYYFLTIFVHYFLTYENKICNLIIRQRKSYKLFNTYY